MIQARLEMEDYTARVLDVIKGKYGLQNRSEALNKLAMECGQEFVEPKANETVLSELDAIYESHKKKYGNKPMTNTELKSLLKL